MNLNDRRVRRTQRLFAESLIALSQEKALEHISIRDITERADVSYSTFFRHYKTIDDLLLHILATTVNEMRALINEPPEQNAHVIFERVRDHPALYRLLLQARRIASVNAYIEKIVSAEVFKGQRPARKPQAPPQIVTHHVMVATLGLIEWWLDNQMPYTPERMGIWYSELVIKPAQALG